MTNPTENEHRQAVINGLREAADFFEAHPELPVPDYPQLRYYPDGTDEEERAEVDRVAEILGVKAASNADDSHYAASRYFGAVQLAAIAITEESMRRHHAVMSYADSVQPEAVSV